MRRVRGRISAKALLCAKLINRCTQRAQHAALAQSVEHLTRNEKVASSILAGGSRALDTHYGTLSARQNRGSAVTLKTSTGNLYVADADRLREIPEVLSTESITTESITAVLNQSLEDFYLGRFDSFDSLGM